MFGTFIIKEGFTKKSTKKSGDSPNGGSRGRFGKSPDFFVDFFCEIFSNQENYLRKEVCYNTPIVLHVQLRLFLLHFVQTIPVCSTDKLIVRSCGVAGLRL